MLNNRKHSRTPFPHLRRIPLHNSKIRAHSLSKINLVHNQQIRPRDSRSTLTRHLITTRNINHVDDEIRQLARVVGSQVITAGLDQQQVRRELLLQLLQREEVRADVFAHCRVRTTACFDGADARRR